MSSRPEQSRVFFALSPDRKTREAIVAIQQGLDLPGKPVAPGNLHVTLAFLGNIPTTRLKELSSAAADLSFSGGMLRLKQVDCFKRAGVAFLAPEELDPELSYFQECLVRGLEQAGFSPDDRPWRPHVTLYRKMRKPCSRITVEPVEWRLRDYVLLSSRLRENGPEYRLLERWKAVD